MRSTLRRWILPRFGRRAQRTLTLLGLVIGFSFSTAINRYDLRKGYEQAEANAIAVEYTRADLLPTEDAARVHDLLKAYLSACRSMRFEISKNLRRSTLTQHNFKINCGPPFGLDSPEYLHNGRIS